GVSGIMDSGELTSIGVTIVGGFLAAILIGFAMKKVLKLVAVVVGLFFAGMAYLQYQQIPNINWDKLQVLSQNTLLSLTNATTKIPGLTPITPGLVANVISCL